MNPEPRVLVIILMRHGEPDVPSVGRISSAEMGRWITSYDAAGIKPHAAGALPLIAGCPAKTTIVSSARRARESVAMLGLENAIVDPLFGEAGLPYLDLPWPKLAPVVWNWIFRKLWRMGLSRHSESYHDAQARAQVAVDRLIEIAEQSGSVLLVGHGTFNSLIAKRLRKLGWHSESTIGDCPYWSTCYYQKRA